MGKVEGIGYRVKVWRKDVLRWLHWSLLIFFIYYSCNQNYFVTRWQFKNQPLWPKIIFWKLILKNQLWHLFQFDSIQEKIKFLKKNIVLLKEVCEFIFFCIVLVTLLKRPFPTYNCCYLSVRKNIHKLTYVKWHYFSNVFSQWRTQTLFL